MDIKPLDLELSENIQAHIKIMEFYRQKIKEVTLGVSASYQGR